MSWPSSNFHHDSFEWIGPPKRDWDAPSISIRNNFNVTFKGPSSTAVRQAGTMNMIGGIFNGLATLGAAWMMSKGNGTGAAAFQAGGSIFGGVFGGGYGAGYGNSYYGGGGSLLSPGLTYYLPIAVGGGGVPVAQGSGAGSGSGVGSGSGAGSGSGVGSGSGAGSGSGVGSGSGSGSGSGAVTASDFNGMIDDVFDTDGDGTHGKVDANGKITDVDEGDIMWGRLGGSNGRHDTRSGKWDNSSIDVEKRKGGIRHGTAADPNNVEKSADGYYKYITLTAEEMENDNLGHLQSGSLLTFEFVCAVDGGVKYRLVPSKSNFVDKNGVTYHKTDLENKYANNPTSLEYVIKPDKAQHMMDFGHGSVIHASVK